MSGDRARRRLAPDEDVWRAYWVEERGWGCGLEGRAGRAGKWVWVGSAGGRGCARERRVERAGWSGLGGAGLVERARESVAREIVGEKEMSFSKNMDDVEVGLR